MSSSINKPDTAESTGANATSVLPLGGPSNGTVNGYPTALPKEFYAPFLSDLSKSRLPSPIRGLFGLENIPGMLSLLAGKPAAETFPISSISINVKSQTPGGAETTLDINSEGNRLYDALQYGRTSGHPYFVKWLMELQTHLHKRSIDGDWKLSVGSGSQDLIYKAFLALTNPGDSVLIEAPVYAGVIPILVSAQANLVEVETDGGGIQSASLRSILENWPQGKPYPKYLYTVPYGCNPTGATASVERRREVLALARKYNFLILDDDPYFLVYYGDYPRPPSYFEHEAQDGQGTGIVLRFDSLSKVLSSGIRVGFVSGPAALVDAIDMHTSSANLQPSSLGQSVVFALLEHWGIAGLESHVQLVAKHYKERRDVFVAAVKKHLDGLVEYDLPVAGMFLWFKLSLPPIEGEAAEGDAESLIRTKALDRGVLALPGTVFYANGRKTAFVRAAFSVLNDADTDEAVRRLGDVLREVHAEAMVKSA